MSSGIYDPVIEKRATFSVSLTVKNGDGSAYDLSSASLFSQIRINVGNILQADFTIDIVGDPTNGLLKLSLTNQQTAELSVAPSSYDLFVDKTDGKSEKLLSGSVTIIDNETSLSAEAPPISNTFTPRRNISFFNSTFANTGLNDEYNYINSGCFSGINVAALNSVSPDKDCRVRVYNALNFDDLTRSVLQDAPDGVGLIAEFSLTSGQPIELAPSIIGTKSILSSSGQSIMVAVSASGSQTINSISGTFDILHFQ
jgi:hypothetical protein